MKSIGLASIESGVAIETIRYYERDGIVPAAERATNGRRLYSPSDISRLKFVKRCRLLGFSTADIKSFQKLAFSSTNTCEEAAEIGAKNLISVKKKISELKDMERSLQSLVLQCQERPARCPMLDGLLTD